ncbi:DUF2628 domain-containing protein [Pseudomonas sp. LD120]|uniref:DUF2628 domain-containing protein n=1 Tax=Pseudomonas sp. LD120 TaxID=485751 RepID=UPI002113C9AB|nr:DUF2628 domain-containing protein [Pseudomonas sp. LD120]
MRSRRGDLETTCVLSGVTLIVFLIGIGLLEGPLFAKLILAAFLCLMIGGWCAIKWVSSQEQPRFDVAEIPVEQLQGYFDRRWVRAAGKPYVRYSFGNYPLHIQTCASLYFSGDTQLKLNRRYRVDALYITGLNSSESGYYLLEETFQEIFDDSDLSAEEKAEVAEREERINEELKAQHKRLYRLYRSPQGELAAVAIGFNFAACLLTLLWSFSAGLKWVTGIALVALSLVLLIPDAGDDHHWFTLGLLLSAGVFGAFGNRWREKQVLSRGMVLVDSLRSCNPEQAIADYRRKVEETAAKNNDCTP